MSGGGTQTVTERADPWGPTRGPLRKGMRAAGGLFRQGGFAADPYEGDRVAGFGDASQMGQQMILDAAGMPTASGVAQGTLSNMMNPGYQSAQLDAVKQNALGSAIPAAAAMFSGSGMTNSSQAMDTVGRAALDAVAPYEYGAHENAMSRALSAAGMAPSVDAGAYLPGQMVSTVGASQDAMSQAMLDSVMARYYEGEDQDMNNLLGYLNAILPISGQDGTATSSQPGPGTAAQLAAGGLTGIGTYGALAGAGLANPVAIPLAVGAGLLGAF